MIIIKIHYISYVKIDKINDSLSILEIFKIVYNTI